MTRPLTLPIHLQSQPVLVGGKPAGFAELLIKGAGAGIAAHAAPLAELAAPARVASPFDSAFTQGDAATGEIAVPQTLEQRLGLGQTLAERIGAGQSLAEQMGLVVQQPAGEVTGSLVWTPDDKIVNWK